MVIIFCTLLTQKKIGFLNDRRNLCIFLKFKLRSFSAIFFCILFWVYHNFDFVCFPTLFFCMGIVWHFYYLYVIENIKFGNYFLKVVETSKIGFWNELRISKLFKKLNLCNFFKFKFQNFLAMYFELCFFRCIITLIFSVS